MARFVRGGLAGVVSVAWLVACSGAFSAASLDGGTNEPRDAEAEPRDTSILETSTPDAAPNDAGADVVADARRPSPCVGQRLFCDDFEDTTKKVGARWDTVREEVGTFDLDPTEVVSGERALRLRLAPGSGTRSSDLAKAIDLPSPNVRVTFDLSVDLAPDLTSQLIELLFVEPQPYPSGVNFQAFEIIVGGAAGPRLEAYRSFTDGGALADSVPVMLASRRYVRGVMELRHAQGNLTAQLSLDGQVVGTRTFATPAPTRVLLRIGAPYTRSVTTPGTVRFDDVFVEAL